MALSVVYGIESSIVLKDICSANAAQAQTVVRWMMDSLVDAALRDAAARPARPQARVARSRLPPHTSTPTRSPGSGE